MEIRPPEPIYKSMNLGDRKPKQEFSNGKQNKDQVEDLEQVEHIQQPGLGEKIDIEV